MKNILVFVSLLAGLLGSSAAFAHPIDCTPGYSDSRCVTPLRHDPIPAPTCPTDPGYTTVSASVWQGWHWSDPQCSYQAPPTCAAGLTQTQAPSWNGFAWVGLACNPPPSGDPGNQEAACAATGNFPGTIAGTIIKPPASQYTISSSGTMTGAASYNNVYMPIISSASAIAPDIGCWGDYVATTGSMPSSSDGSVYDIFTATSGQVDANTGQPGIVAASICYLPTGTNNVAHLLLVGMMKNPGTCH